MYTLVSYVVYSGGDVNKTLGALSSLSVPPNWIFIKNNIEKAADDGCILSFDVRTSAFALRYLMPEKTWCFIDADTVYTSGPCAEKKKLYFFDPLPYGLKEEADSDLYGSISRALLDKYGHSRLVKELDFYALEGR